VQWAAETGTAHGASLADNPANEYMPKKISLDIMHNPAGEKASKEIWNKKQVT
jgi:hypothetical protein